MNGPPPNGNEGIVDIFVLSTSGTLAPMIREHLEQNGYQVTLFDDGEHLLETLKTGKPNLLICDTTDSALPAFDICRQMKADRDLWVIPVLILTGASALSDLLFVLDSNADNFISLPYDLPYLLSLIGGMRDTPVERPTPDQIKTQFKIQHNDHIFVITADRRKLLEFLLSSFEIAVTKHEEISRAKEQIRFLDQSVKKLESATEENKEAIRLLNKTVNQKDQDIRVFQSEIADKDQLNAELKGEKETLQKDLEITQSLLTDTRKSLNTLTQARDAALVSHNNEIRTLNEKITNLSGKIDSLTHEHARVTDSLRLASSRCSETEKDLAGLRVQKDQADVSLATRLQEYNDMKSAWEKEKTRALAAEEKIKIVLTSTEERNTGLTRVIEELTGVSKQQESGIARLNEDLADAKAHSANLEVQITSLEKEKELVESALGARIDDLREQLEELQVQFSAATGVIEEKETAFKSLDVNFAALNLEMDKTVEKVRSLTAELEDTRSALTEEKLNLAAREDEIAEMTSEKERASATTSALSQTLSEIQSELQYEREQRRGSEERLNTVILEQTARLHSLEGAHTEVKSDLDLHRTDLVQTRSNLDIVVREKTDLENTLTDAKVKIHLLEQEIHSVSAGQAQAGQQARSLGEELEQVRAALETERRLRRVAEESMQSALAAHERSSLDIGRLRGERGSLEAAFEAAQASTHNAERERNTALQNLAKIREELAETKKEQSLLVLQQNEKMRLLSEELESARASSSDTVRAKDAALQDLKKISEKHAEMEKLQEHEAAQQREKIQNLSEDLDSARIHSKTLEERVETLIREKTAAENTISSLSTEIDHARTALADEWEEHVNEKMAAENTISSLSTEIDHARTALADEWEDHMNAQEQLMVATEVRDRPAGPALPKDTEAEPVKKRAVIVKGPDLPMVVRPASLPMKIPQKPEPDVVRITGVEDLFEDDVPVSEIVRKEPTETAFPGTVDYVISSQKAESVLPETDSFNEEPGVSFDNVQEVREGSEYTEDSDDEESAGPEYEESAEEPMEDMPGEPDDVVKPGFSFNRAQWFDLLRWSHHSGALSQEQRMQIVRMGRLIQRGRRLTHKQEEQVMEMITLAQAMGYRFTT